MPTIRISEEQLNRIMWFSRTRNVGRALDLILAYAESGRSIESKVKEIIGEPSKGNAVPNIFRDSVRSIEE